MSDKYPYCDFYGAWAKIYTLADHSGNVFYVGATTSTVANRVAQHISECRLVNHSKYASPNKRKVEHIRSLDFKVTATIVDMIWVTAHRKKDLIHKRLVKDLEKSWIEKYFELGYSLVNGRPAIAKPVPSPEYIGKIYTTNEEEILDAGSAEVGSTRA